MRTAASTRCTWTPSRTARRASSRARQLTALRRRMQVLLAAAVLCDRVMSSADHPTQSCTSSMHQHNRVPVQASSAETGACLRAGEGTSQQSADSPLWLSLSVEAELFPETRTNGFAPLTDWQLVARPPLVLENQLPVPGTFLVWEQPQVRDALSAL